MKKTPNSLRIFICLVVLSGLSAAFIFAVRSSRENTISQIETPQPAAVESASLAPAFVPEKVEAETVPSNANQNVSPISPEKSSKSRLSRTKRAKEKWAVSRDKKTGLARLSFDLAKPNSDLPAPPKFAAGVFEGDILHRKSWFLEQRSYGLGYIPDNARRAAKVTADLVAPPMDDNLVAPTAWKFIGPKPVRSSFMNAYGTVSGRINAIAVKPNNPNIVLIGAATGGLWLSTNALADPAGANPPVFAPVSDDDNLIDIAVGAIAFAPSNPNTVYAGMGDRDSGYVGTGVLKSTNSGISWTQMSSDGLPAKGRTTQIAVDPTDAGIVYLSRTIDCFQCGGTLPPTPRNPPAESGFYRWTDASGNWTRTLAGNVTDFAVSSFNSNIIYAAVVSSSQSGAASPGIYKSTDGGASFNRITNLNIPAAFGDLRVAASADPLEIIVYGGDGGANFNLVVGLDTGSSVTWTINNIDLTQFDSGQFRWNTYLVADPTDPNQVYIGSRDVFRITLNGSNNIAGYQNLTNAWTYTCIPNNPPPGCTNGWSWQPTLSKAHSDQQAFAFAGNSATFFIGSDGGLQRTSDGGTTFVSLNQTLGLTQALNVTIDRSNNSRVFTGTQDNGTQRTDSGDQWFEFWGGDGNGVAVHPTNANMRFANIYAMRIDRFNGDSFLGSILTPAMLGNAGSRAGFYNPMVTNGVDDTLYFGTYTLAFCTNCDSPFPFTPNWSAPTLGGNILDLTRGGSDVLSAIDVQRVAFSNSQIIYTGSTRGAFFVSQDGGATFTNRTGALDAAMFPGNPNPPGRWITSIRIDPTNAATAYITVSGFGTSHLFRSTNFGASITPINFPVDIPINDFLIDPTNSAIFYAATDNGVFRSFDAGQNWNQFNSGMPPVIAMKFDALPGGKIVVATYGRGVYELERATTAPKISGYIKNPFNLPQENINVVLTGTATGTTTTDANGFYQFTNLTEGGNYTVTPSRPHYIITPQSQTFNGLTGDVSADFTAVTPASIHGRVTNICGEGEGGITITANPSGSQIVTDTNGYYSLPVPRGGSYTITPSASGYTFEPTTRFVPNVDGDAFNQHFVATPPTVSYIWTGVAANTAPLYDSSWTNSGNWGRTDNQPNNGGYPRCNDIATLSSVGAGHEISIGTRFIKQLNFHSGVLKSGTLTIRERMNWSGFATGLTDVSVTIQSAAELRTGGESYLLMMRSRITNNGKIIHTGTYNGYIAPDTSNGAACGIDNFGEIRLESTQDQAYFYIGNSNCSFNNKPSGTIIKPSGTHSLIFAGAHNVDSGFLINEGKIIVNSGEIVSYETELKTGSRIEGAGKMHIGGATLGRLTGTAIVANGATLEIGGCVHFYGCASFEGTSTGRFETEGTGRVLLSDGAYLYGVLNFYGTTVIENVYGGFGGIPTVAVNNFGQNGEFTSIVNNYGTINWLSNQIALDRSTFNNHGTFNILHDAYLSSYAQAGQAGVFNNLSTGVIRKSGTNGVAHFDTYPYNSKFNNHGLLDVQSGTFKLNAGAGAGRFKTAANTTIEILGGDGYLFQAAYFDTAGTAKATGGNISGSIRGLLRMDGTIVNNPGGLTILSPTQTLPGGTLEFRSGSFTDTNLIIQSGAFLLLDSTTSGGNFYGTTVTNNGTVQWIGADNNGFGVAAGANNLGLTFNNNGTFFLQSDGNVFRHGDNSTFNFNNNINGVFKKSDGNGTTKMEIYGHKFTNFGKIEVSSGILDGYGVQFEFKNNSRIKGGGGKLLLQAATSKLQGSVTLEGDGGTDNYSLQLGEGTLDGNSGTLVPDNNGGLLWSKGTIQGTLTLGTGLRTAIQTVSGSSNYVLLNGTIRNAGTINWLTDMDINMPKSTINNLQGAIFNALGTGDVIGEYNGSPHFFNNAGTLNIGQPTGMFNSQAANYDLRFTNEPTGVINMDIAGTTDFDKIVLAQVMNLGGRLNINFAGGFVPNVGDEFKLFEGQTTGAARQGSFAQVSLPSVSGKSLRLIYGADDLTLQTDPIYIWTGAANSNWNNPANWQGNQVPPPNALVEIPANVTNNPDLGSGNTTVTNLTIEDGESIAIGSGETLTINGVLNLSGGNISTIAASLQENSQSELQNQQLAGGLLIVGANGAVNRTDGHVIGKIKKIFGGVGSFTFPVGTMNGYSPVDAVVTSGAGDLTVSAAQTPHAALPNPNFRLQRFWTLEEGGAITANLIFTYLDADILGVESTYKLFKVENRNAIQMLSGVVDPSQNTATIANVSSFSDWSLGSVSPTAASVTIGGRVTTPDGRGISQAQVTITDSTGSPRTVQTNSFGYYSFADVRVGETYVFNVRHKRYGFANSSQVIVVNNEINELNFVAN
ncbi:MAG: carboxypeptidase regulatory-like domain-containing protein [Acidobacteriota bacterium]|nr:carboxypeptidase regulatory-like domain-containing protein [Acidobacteriota bacterium]